jgi:hypothetical protein
MVRKSSRKGRRWLSGEESLLVELRRDRRLPWSDVARLFSEQYPGRSQGSIQVYVLYRPVKLLKTKKSPISLRSRVNLTFPINDSEHVFMAELVEAHVLSQPKPLMIYKRRY